MFPSTSFEHKTNNVRQASTQNYPNLLVEILQTGDTSVNVDLGTNLKTKRYGERWISIQQSLQDFYKFKLQLFEKLTQQKSGFLLFSRIAKLLNFSFSFCFKKDIFNVTSAAFLNQNSHCKYVTRKFVTRSSLNVNSITDITPKKNKILRTVFLNLFQKAEIENVWKAIKTTIWTMFLSG